MNSCFIILGHTGRLGQALLDEFPSAHILNDPASNKSRRQRDTETYVGMAVDLIHQIKPQYVFNCLGFTNVDEAESHYEEAMELNAIVPGVLAEACRRVHGQFVHFSTDFVFSGRKEGFYTELDDPSPLSVYGQSKLAGEKAVINAEPDSLILRCSWLFGPGKGNFVNAIINKVKLGVRFGVVEDQIGSPTYTLDLCKAVHNLIDRGAAGLVHVANQGQVSRYGLALATLGAIGVPNTMVYPIKTSELPFAAPRPSNASLDCKKYMQCTGRNMPVWQDAIINYLDRKKGNVNSFY